MSEATHLSTPQEIRQFAYDGNYTVLMRYVQAHFYGKYTWEQAMQAAAVAQAKLIANLTKDLLDARANTTNLIIEAKP